VNTELVDVLSLPAEQEENVKNLISTFVTETGSEIGNELIKDWGSAKKRISLIMPRDYAKVLTAIEKAEREGLPVDKVIMEAVNG
jgi:glutamate synthase (NADPH/NADH) large chain